MHMCEFVYSTTRTGPKRREQENRKRKKDKRIIRTKEEVNAHVYIYIGKSIQDKRKISVTLMGDKP